jgi:hypothetical protein
MAVTRTRLLHWAATALCVLLSSAVATSAGASTAGSGAAPTAPFCCRDAPPWRGAAGFRLSRTAGFDDVVAISWSDAWAVGNSGAKAVQGIAAHWNGKVWRQVPLPVKRFTAVSVSARAGSSAWVFGFQYDPGSLVDKYPGYGLQWAHGRWHVHQLPSARAEWDALGDLQSVVISNDDVWVTGNGQNGLGQTTGNIAWNWTGASWVRHPLHVTGVRSISGSSSENVWVAGSGATNRTFAVRWNGTRWRRVPVPDLADASVVADSVHNVWLAGSVVRSDVRVGAVAHWNGARWSGRNVIGPVEVPTAPAWTDGHRGLWFGPYAHETGGTWYVPTALPSWRGCGFGAGIGVVAAIPGTSAAWFAGACGRDHSTRLIAMIAIDGHL